MTPSKRGVGAPPIIDEESDAIVLKGASLAQLAMIFSMDARDIKMKMHGQVKPCGERRGHAIYAIKEVARYVVSPPYDMDEFIQKMTISDLPTILRKEYWAGMRSRQLYEKEAAELWPTSQVVETISSLLKTLRLSLLLSREAVERETELSDRQRAIMTRVIDTSLEDLYVTTTRQFAASKAAGSTAEISSAEALSPEEL